MATNQGDQGDPTITYIEEAQAMIIQATAPAFDPIPIPVNPRALADVERMSRAACQRHGIRAGMYLGMMLRRNNSGNWHKTDVRYEDNCDVRPIVVTLGARHYTITRGDANIDGTIEQLRWGDEVKPLYTQAYPGCYQYDPSPYVRYTLERSPLSDMQQEQAWTLMRVAYTIPRSEVDTIILAGKERVTSKHIAAQESQIVYGNPDEQLIWDRVALWMSEFGE